MNGYVCHSHNLFTKENTTAAKLVNKKKRTSMELFTILLTKPVWRSLLHTLNLECTIYDKNLNLNTFWCYKFKLIEVHVVSSFFNFVFKRGCKRFINYKTNGLAAEILSHEENSQKSPN